jgi:rhomboid family GlyGly-CTERM serine protease
VRATAKSPVVTLIVVGLAVMASASPVVSNWLVWDRAAIADGQWWRLVTGNLVHVTARHLWWDALAVTVAGWFIGTRAPRSLAILTLVAAAVIGLSIFVFCPQVRLYCGLSGVACAMFGYLALLGIRTGSRARWCGLAMLILVACKVAWELTTGRTIFVPVVGNAYVVLPLAHATGLVVGVLNGAIDRREMPSRVPVQGPVEGGTVRS